MAHHDDIYLDERITGATSGYAGPLTVDSLYSSLPVASKARTIRLLDLDDLPQWSKRVGGTSNDIPLTGTLRVVSLETCPSFAALSYVWGRSSSPSDAILCGNVEIEITSNCRDALRQLRQRYGSMTIWVDAICVNQKDEREKSSQLPLMEEIYTWARQVYVWLGNGNEKSDRAMSYLTKLALRNPSMCLAGLPWMSTFDKKIRTRVMIKYKLLAFSIYIRHLFNSKSPDR
jgi:hypothetical protein